MRLCQVLRGIIQVSSCVYSSFFLRLCQILPAPMKVSFKLFHLSIPDYSLCLFQFFPVSLSAYVSYSCSTDERSFLRICKMPHTSFPGSFSVYARFFPHICQFLHLSMEASSCIYRSFFLHLRHVLPAYLPGRSCVYSRIFLCFFPRSFLRIYQVLPASMQGTSWSFSRFFLRLCKFLPDSYICRFFLNSLIR